MLRHRSFLGWDLFPSQLFWVGLVPIPIYLGWTCSHPNLLGIGSWRFVSNAPTTTSVSKQHCPIFKMDESSSPFGQQCLDDDINPLRCAIWTSSDIWEVNPFNRVSDRAMRISDEDTDAVVCPPSRKPWLHRPTHLCRGTISAPTPSLHPRRTARSGHMRLEPLPCPLNIFRP